MLRRSACFALAILSLGAFSTPAYSATQQQIDNARAKGLAWLLLHQAGDGSWRGTAGSEVAATSSAVEALTVAGIRSYPFIAGVSWLGNTRAKSVDSLARQVAALTLAGRVTTASYNELIAARNPKYAWGAYGGYDTSFPDTSLALLGLLSTIFSDDFSKGIYCSIVAKQSPTDGSWTFGPRPTTNPSSFQAGAVLPTAYNVLILQKALSTPWSLTDSYTCTEWGVGSEPSTRTTRYRSDVQNAVTSGLTFLGTKRIADGGFGDFGTSTVIDSAVAYWVLREVPSANQSYRDSALDFLIGKQSASDGSWGADAFETALVTRVLPPPTSPLPDYDGDGIPDAVEIAMGRNPYWDDSRLQATGGGKTGPGLSISTPFIARGYRQKPFSANIGITGGTPPYTFAEVSGSLPPGLALNGSTGTVQGTPTTNGTYPVVHSVTDSRGATMNIEGKIFISDFGKDSDLNGDLKADIFWRHSTNGFGYRTYLNGLIPDTGTYPILYLDNSYKTAAIGDFDGDGIADVMYHSASMNFVFGYYRPAIEYATFYAFAPGAGWNVIGSGDFNGDGRSDVLWQNNSSGQNLIWLMNADGTFNSVSTSSWGLDWVVAGIGDLNGDGKADIIWHYLRGAQKYVWLMDGATVTLADWMSAYMVDDWNIHGLGDFNGDGKADVLWRNSATGENYIYYMDGRYATGSLTLPSLDPSWSVALVGDINNDGNADIVWRQNSTGWNLIWQMNGTSTPSTAQFSTDAAWRAQPPVVLPPPVYYCWSCTWGGGDG
ncbi:MAG TPA: FG-GAP-like repeat-containing protein [Burkholderiales bacterium]